MKIRRIDHEHMEDTNRNILSCAVLLTLPPADCSIPDMEARVEIRPGGNVCFKSFLFSTMAVLVAIGGLSGCEQAANLSGLKPAETTRQIGRERITTLEKVFTDGEVDTCARRAPDDPEARQCRDNIAFARLEAEEISFQQFEWSLWAGDAGFSTASDIAILGLTAAGGLSPGGAARVLSATATAVTGAKTSVEKNWLYSKTINELIFSMALTRAQTRAHILSCLAQPPSVYSVRMAMYDLDQFHTATILPSALANLAASASPNTPQTAAAVVCGGTTVSTQENNPPPPAQPTNKKQ